jgi:hypothetical protein
MLACDARLDPAGLGMASRALSGLGLSIAVSALIACGTDSGSPQQATAGTPSGGAAGTANPSAGTSSGATSSMSGSGGSTSAGTGGGPNAGEAGSSSGGGAAGSAGGGAGGGSTGPKVDLTDAQLYEFELDRQPCSTRSSTRGPRRSASW